MEKRFRPCPLCGSGNTDLIHAATSSIPSSSKQIQVTDKYFGLHGDIVRCVKCGFCYVGKDIYVKKVVGLYKTMSDQAYLQEEKERRHSFIRVLTMIEKLRNGKKGKILDIGCCTGGLLAEAKKRGWEVTGVDPSSWACDVAFRFHNLHIVNSTIESYSQSFNKFDAFTLLDVLEHVEDPVLLLRKVCKMLKKRGNILYSHS